LFSAKLTCPSPRWLLLALAVGLTVAAGTAGFMLVAAPASAATTVSFVPAPGSPFAVGIGPEGITSADFDGDGKLDLAIMNYNDNNVTVLLGDGSGGFTPATGSPFAVGLHPLGITSADFNGDTKPDLAMANIASNNVTVLLNTTPSPTPPGPTPPGPTPPTPPQPVPHPHHKHKHHGHHGGHHHKHKGGGGNNGGGGGGGISQGGSQSVG
jgi:hypothetical protein